jgi:hypothetical protein
MSRVSYAMMEAGFIPGDLGAFKKEGGKIRLYDSGGGQQTPTSQTVTNLSYPAEYKPMVMEATQRAVTEASTPYTAYRGNRIAEFDPFQLTAQQAVANLGPSQQLGPATQYAASAGARAGDIQYQPQTNFGAPSFTQPGLASLYMSPYAQNVVDIQKREAQRQGDIANQQLQAGAVKQGAFGGSRQAILQAEANRNLAQQMGDIQKAGSQAAYEQAQNLYSNEAQRQMAAQQATEQSRQYGAGLGLQGLSTQLQAAQQLGSLGEQQMSQQQAIINAMQNVGQQRQAMNQQQLSQQYQDFLTQKQHPYQQIAFLQEMLKGVPTQSTQSIYQAPASTSAMMASAVPLLYGANKIFGAEGGLMGLGVHNLSKG